jgi:uncharacterized repeat protein (TIGR01451 family)
MKISVPKISFYKLLFILLFFLLSSKSFSQAPVNDDCINSNSLTSGTTCSSTAGTVVNATASTGVPAACSGTVKYDVWYSFTAATANPTITLSSVGSNFSSPLIQVFSGSCSSLSSVACSSGPSLVTSGLTVGNTYNIRVYSVTGSAPATNGSFNICITDPAPAVVDYGKSFVNISKGNNGGTVEPGDTLEIRATFVVKSGTAYNASFTDAVPANTTYISNTLRILTNEGKIYQQWTDASDGDPGTITGSAITINLGNGADNINGGSVAHTNKPSFFGGACIMVVSYRVVVNAVALGTVLDLGNGSFSYKKNNGIATTTLITFPSASAEVYKNYGMCSNTIGINALLSESGGTFGSGSVKDRTPSAKVPANYTYALFNSTTGMPNDYYYGVSNNTSGGSTNTTGYSTLNTWSFPDNSSPSHRIFGVWDIIGDHTGASNPLLGNAATDDNAGQSGGYMAVINAAYRTDTAFLDTVNNLCPNTYYQYSAWFRNICSKCGCDSNGKGASSAGYIPTATGDSSGVYPNLTFNVNGADYYTTGNMLHTGQWIQKGLTYLTGPTQTSMIIHIRNNAPGGGGNDWAIDDIAVASCLPNIDLTPNKPDTLCQGADDTVRFKVSSYFNNYTEWQLEKSVDGGATWSSAGNDTTGASSTGSSTPVYNSSTNQYEYLVTRYFRLSTGDTLTTYRLTVASTSSNLSNSNCAITGSAHKFVYGVNCMIILPTNIISFRGNTENGFANLQWISGNETSNITYTIERSDDQVNFVPAGTIQGNAGEGLGATYHFTDAKAVGAATYYRINMTSSKYNKYSTVILLSNSGINFDLKALTNPFSDWLSFDLTVPNDNAASFTLVDMYGRIVKQVKQNVSKGLNSIRLYNLSILPDGTYTLQVRCADNMINKKVIKIKN